MAEHPPSSCSLVLTRKTAVPDYLQVGEFYQSLNDHNDEQISVPANTLKPNVLIENNNDLEHLLSSLRFWLVENVLQEVVNYCFENESCKSVLEAFEKDFRYIGIILQMISLTEAERAKFAIKSGILELVVILHESCRALPDGCHIAARAGHLLILKFLHEQGGKMDPQKLGLVSATKTNYLYGCACAHAAAGGNLACLEYLHKCGCSRGYNLLLPAIMLRQTACVEYALQHGWSVEPECYSIVAARLGHLDILKLLHTAGATWIEETCMEAVCFGHLDCLQYLHENGCPWDFYTCSQAAANGHLECLKYAHEQGCPWCAHTSARAAEEGHLDCLQYVHENGCPWNSDTCMGAARHGHVDCLRYAHEHGCAWDKYTTFRAAMNGQLECLKYSHEQGCSWDEQTLNTATEKGHLHCLKYAHEQGCPASVILYKVAVQAKQLACAEYIKIHISGVTC